MKLLVNFLIVLLLLSGDITAQWFHQNSGTTANFGSVFFIDANIGWTCGTGGKIIKTTNGGLDWFDQNSNTTVGLNTIQFIDAGNGWACGSNQILKTTDGGLLWSVQNFPSSTSLYAIQFVTTNIGWIISHFADSAYIHKSTDGGVSWTIQHQAQNEYYESMHFLDENTGWVTFSFGFSGVLKTTDGGNIWTQYNANFSGSPMHIRFVDNLTGWTSHNTLGSYEISKSTDGGVTWFTQIAESFKFIHSFNFPNSSIGYAAGWEMYIPPNPDQEFIMKTSDGGSSWFEQYKGVGRLNSIFFVNDQLGWAVGNDGEILTTENGGVVPLIQFYPPADTAYILGGCTTPEIISHNLFSTPVRDSISINPGFNTSFMYYDSLGSPVYIENYYFIAIDSLDEFEYELWFHPKTYPPFDPVLILFDSTFYVDQNDFDIQLIAKRNGIQKYYLMLLS